MGTILELVKAVSVFIFLVVLIVLIIGSIFIEFTRIANDQEPYFFTRSIESYEGNIFDDVEPKMIEHFEKHSSEFDQLIPVLLNFSTAKKIDISFTGYLSYRISYSFKNGYSSRYIGETDQKKARETLSKVSLTTAEVDRLHDQLDKISCTSIEKYDDGFKIGCIEDKDGEFFYRFLFGETLEKRDELLDSCLIKKYTTQIFLEYEGRGRGQDCKRNKNPEGFDDRNFFKKWYDIITGQDPIYSFQKIGKNTYKMRERTGK